MDVLWTKEKYHKIFSTDNILFHASGDGATAGKCCRLCGGDNNLKRFVDKYQLNGIEGQYDQLLYECFGVRVSPPDSLICEWCVRQLTNTEKFRNMVYAAFGLASSTNVSRCGSAKSSKNADKNDEAAVITYKDMVELLSTKAGTKTERTNTIGKRVNEQCAVCKQKYPHIIQSGDEDFVCSRCKKNGAKATICGKCNVVMPYKMMQEHMELHAKAKLRRRNGLQKKLSLMKQQDTIKIRNVPKYKCPVCPKRYMTAQHLAEHIKCMHSTNNKSHCEICGKDVKYNETFDKHIQTHAEQVANFQCPPKSIRTKLSLKMHRIAREKGSV